MTAKTVPEVGATASVFSVTAETKTPSIAVLATPSIAVLAPDAVWRLISVRNSAS